MAGVIKPLFINGVEYDAESERRGLGGLVAQSAPGVARTGVLGPVPAVTLSGSTVQVGPFACAIGTAKGVYLTGLDSVTPAEGPVAPADATNGRLDRIVVVPGDLRIRPDVGPGGVQHLKLVAALDQLMGHLPGNNPAPLVVDEDGLRRHVLARLDGEPSDPVWVNPWLVRYGFQLFAPDYRRFAGDGSGPTHSVTVGLPFTEGGRVRPYSLPSTINATVVSGSVTVANAGNAPAPVTVTFDGPVPRPSVRSAVTGRSQWFDLDVLPGQSLVVDQDAHTVLLNGVGRGNTMRGQWLDLVPDDVLVFDAGAYDPAARMTVSWFDSWK